MTEANTTTSPTAEELAAKLEEAALSAAQEREKAMREAIKYAVSVLVENRTVGCPHCGAPLDHVYMRLADALQTKEDVNGR